MCRSGRVQSGLCLPSRVRVQLLNNGRVRVVHLWHFSGLHGFGSHFQIKYGSGSVPCSIFTGLFGFGYEFLDPWRPLLRMSWTSTNAKFTLHDFSPIFHSPTGFDKLPTNARDRRQIGARSREWHSRSVNYQRHDLRESPTCRRRPRNIWHAKYLELSAILNPAVWMSSDPFWLKNTSAMTYSQWESKIQGSWKFEEVFFFFFIFFCKASIRIYRTGRLHEDEEGFFFL